MKKELCGKFIPVEEGIVDLKKPDDVVPKQAYSEAGTENLRTLYTTQSGVVRLGTLCAIHDTNHQLQARNHIGSLRSVCDSHVPKETRGW